MKLKTALAAHAALLQLIAADKTNKFIFASAVRIKLAGNLRRVRPLYEDFTDEVTTFLKTLPTAKEANGQVQIPNHVKDAAGVEQPNPDLAAFLAKQKELDSSEHEVAFSPIKPADLGENQIPLDILADLFASGLLEEALTPPAAKAAS